MNRRFQRALEKKIFLAAINNFCFYLSFEGVSRVQNVVNQVRQEFHVTFRSSAARIKVEFAIRRKSVKHQFDVVNKPGDIGRHASSVANGLVEFRHLG